MELNLILRQAKIHKQLRDLSKIEFALSLSHKLFHQFIISQKKCFIHKASITHSQFDELYYKNKFHLTDSTQFRPAVNTVFKRLKAHLLPTPM